MTSNGGSGGDYQAVEANENRRRRINQVVTALNMFVVLFSKLGTYSLNPYRKSPYFFLHYLTHHLIFISILDSSLQIDP